MKKKRGILFLIILLSIYGCLRTAKDNVEIELKVEVSSKTVDVDNVNIKITTNGDIITINGNKINVNSTPSGIYNENVKLQPGENKIIVESIINAYGKEFKKDEGVTINYLKQGLTVNVDNKNFIKDSGKVLYPINGQIFNNTSNTYLTKSVKRSVSTSSGIQTGFGLDKIEAIYDGSSNLDYNTDDDIGIYVFINGKIVDYKIGKVTGTKKVEYPKSSGTGKIILNDNGDNISDFILNEGKNTIFLMLINLKKGSTIDIGKPAGEGPVEVTADVTLPKLEVTYPLNGNKLNFDDTLSSFGKIKLELNASDDYKVNLYGALIKDNGKTTAAEVRKEGNKIQKDNNEIQSSTSSAIIKTDVISVYIDKDPSATGKYSGITGNSWYLYILAEDENGNQTFNKIEIQGSDTSADLKTEQLGIGIDNGTIEKYSGTTLTPMQIDGKSITFQYTSKEDKNAIINLVKIEEVNGNIVEGNKVALTHENGSETYTGTFDLEKDFGYSLSNPKQGIEFEIEMTDEALNYDKKILNFIYIDENALAAQINIKDSDLTFYSDDNSTTGKEIIPLADNVENKYYFNYDGSTDLIIKSVKINNPDKLDYKVKIENNVNYITSDDKLKYNIDDIKLNKSLEKSNLQIYLGKNLLKSITLILLIDAGDINKDGIKTDSAISLSEVDILQNSNKIHVKGNINISSDNIDEYDIQANFINASLSESTWIGGLQKKIVDDSNINFEGDVAFNYSEPSLGEYDNIQIRAYNELINTTPTEFNLDTNGTNNFLDVKGIQVDGIDDSVLNWKIASEIQDIDIFNGDKFSKLELYFGDVLKETNSSPSGTGTDFPSVDLTGVSSIKIIGTLKSPVSPVVKIERVISLTKALESEKPKFISLPVKNMVYKNDFIITGKVDNTDAIGIVSIKDSNGNTIKWKGGNTSIPEALKSLMISSDGTFYSPNLADDVNYSNTVTTTNGIYTDFENGEGIIEGNEYSIKIRAKKTNGAFIDYEYIAVFDTLAPTEYHIRDSGNTYNKFGDNNDTQWEGIDKVYFDLDGNLKEDSTDTLYTILDNTGTDYDIKTPGGDYRFSIDETKAIPDIQKGWMILIENYMGYDDYLAMNIPYSTANGDYSNFSQPTISGEDVTVVLTDKDDNIILKKIIKKDDSGKARELLVDLGDNKYDTINVYLQDKNLNNTKVYTFSNNIYLNLKQSDINAEIYEGFSKDTPIRELKINQISNLTDITLNIYKGTVNESLIMSVPNVNLNQSGGYTLPLSGDINNGDTLTLKATDKYGNNMFVENKSDNMNLKIIDKLPPELPTNIIVTNKKSPELDEISGISEVGSTVILRGVSNNEIARAVTDSSGKFTIKVNGDNYSIMKLETIDAAGNSSINSKLHDPYEMITDKFAQNYNYTIAGGNITSNIIKTGNSIAISWNSIIENAADVSKGNILDHYRVDYYNGSNKIYSQDKQTNSASLKPEDLGIYNLTTITAKIYGVSKLGFETLIPDEVSFKIDSSPPIITALDSTKIDASVKNNEITIPVSALNLSTVGIGNNDKIYVDIDGASKEWTGLTDLIYTNSINNDSIFTLKLIDLAGNESSSITIKANDDEAPSIDGLVISGGINAIVVNGTSYLQLKIKHTLEDNVMVYAYDSNTTNANLIGVVNLGLKNIVSQMAIKASDATNVYLKVMDNSSNKNISSAKQLSLVTIE